MTDVTQYIGARYVPIFGRIGEDSIEWDNSKEYEPLTIVSHAGNSYTSRQYVPIGIDIANTDYWALTGNYNAQIEQYRRELAAHDSRITANAQAIADEVTARMAEDTTIRGIITDLQGDLSDEVTARTDADAQIRTDFAAADTQLRTDFAAADTQIRTDFAAADTQIRTDFAAADTQIHTDIKNLDTDIKNVAAGQRALVDRIITLESIPFNGDVVLLGDSYGEGYNPDGNVTSWVEMATTALTRRGVNVYSRCLGGVGIVNEHDGVNFATLLDQLGNSLTDAQKKKVGTVYIGGGWNDGYNPSVSDFRTGINAIENYAHSHFSNAKIVYDWFGFGNWLVNSSVANQSLSITSSIERAFEAVRTSNFKNVSLLDSTYLLRKASYFASDGIHLTLSGQQKLANRVIDVLAGVFDVDAKSYGSVSGIPIDGVIDGSISSNTAYVFKNGAFVFNQINAFVKGQIILSEAIPVSFTGLVFTMYTTNPNALIFGTEPFDIPITICVSLENSNAGTVGSFINVNGFLHFHVNTDTHRMEIQFYARLAVPAGNDYLRGNLKEIQFPA